tara:strand:+ start:671 stop:2575 length:1905 start_codon:yes stop_codon:yes gene_type:complete
MASIDIPNIGTVTVNDLATEETADNILATQRAMLAALTGVKEEDGQTNVTLAQLLREQKKSNSDDEGKFRRYAQETGKATQAVAKQFINSGNNKIQDVITNTLSSLGASVAVTTAFGMAQAAAEELGEMFRLSGRFGVSFAENLSEMNMRTARVGLSMGQLTQMVGEESLAIREFGDGIQDGTNRFLRTVESFRAASDGFGNFGMKAEESAEFISKELELRRKTMETDAFRAMTEQELANSMAENIKQQEAMAKVTGQDVRTRLQAQMEMRNSAIAQSFLSEQSGETQERFKALAASLSTIPGGKQLGEAIVNGIATDLPANAFAPELIARLGGNADKLISFVMGNIEGGMDSSQFGTQVQQLVQDLRGPAAQNANVLRTQAALGDTTAMTILTFQQGLADIDDVAGEFEQSLKDLDDAFGTTEGKARGLTSELQTTNQLLAAQKLNLIINVAEGMTGEKLGLPEAALKIQEGLQGALGSEIMEKFLSGVGRGLGKAILEPFYNAGTGNIEFNDTLFFAGLGARALGFNKIAMGLMASQMSEGAGELMSASTSLTSKEIDEARQLGMTKEEYMEKKVGKVRSNIEKLGDFLGGDNNPLNTKIDSNSINALGESIATGLSKVPGFAEFFNKNIGP